MVDPVEVVSSAVGYGSGIVYEFGSNILTAIGNGDFSELLRLLSTLLLVLIGFQLSKRALRLISGTLILFAKILVLLVGVTFAIDAYQNGVQSTLKAVTGLTLKLVASSWTAAGPIKNLAADAKSFSYEQAIKLYDRAESVRRELMT